MLFVGNVLRDRAVAFRKAQALTGNVGKFLAVILAQGVDEPRVDAVCEQQDLDILLAKKFEMRACN